MPQPTIYERHANFTDHSTSEPLKPHSGVNLDAEFDAVKLTLDQVLANIAKIQRDDGEVANQTIGIDQLKSGIKFGLNPTTTWATATAYSTFDGVWNGRALYYVKTAHTSSVFADDLAAGKLALIVDFEGQFTAAQAQATAAAASATLAASAQAAAEAAQAAAELSATAAAGSASDALTYRDEALAAAAAAAGADRFQSEWNASTNTPALPAASGANKGNYYVVNVAGTTSIDGIADWEVGDHIVSVGTKWVKIDNTEPNATETLPGKAEIATQAEVDGGVDDSRFVTPLKLATRMAAYVSTALAGWWTATKAAAQTLTAAWGYSFQPIAYNAGAPTWNVSTTPAGSLDMTGNPVIDATGIEDGKVYQLRVYHNGGARTPTFNATRFKWGDDGQPSFSASAAKYDYLTFVGSGTTELHHMGTKTGF
jgi:hypothetical protein